MISTHLAGGLGNYMFQIAAAQALAWDLGVGAGFDFNLAAQVHRNIREYQDNILGDVRDVKNHTFTTRYNEPNFGYNELPKVDNQLLIGYFQSEKYFKHQRGVVLELFDYPDDDKDRLNKLCEYYGVRGATAIHVRRGDYLKLNQHHPPLGIDYYVEAIKLVPSTRYIVFSDDIKWCQENFTYGEFTFVDGLTDIEDLYIMKSCDHNIIANSTFSWWGAWLNEYTDKIVVAPKKWFGPAKGNIVTKDLIPEEWLLIG